MASNTKYLVRRQGGPLEAATTPRPSIEPTEVMIRLKAIAINPADIKMIDQGARGSSWPLVPGLDGAGIVEAVGNEVKNFTTGDEVLAMFVPGDKGGSYQTFAVVKEQMVAKKPSTWSFEEAASLGVCYVTGVMALGIGLKASLPFLDDGPTGFEPSSVLVLGGSSALGAAVIQLLRISFPGCKIFATSSPKHHSHIVSLGANAAFDRSSASLAADVKLASPGSRGVDAIIDAVGAGNAPIFEAFGSNGSKKYAQVWTGEDEIEVPSDVNSVLFRTRDMPQVQGSKNIMLALQRLLEQEKYKLPLPLQEVGQGLEGLAKGLNSMRKGVSGEKLVVTLTV